MKVGALIKDDDGDFGVIVGFDGTNPMVYYTETVFKNVRGMSVDVDLEKAAPKQAKMTSK